MGRTAITNTKKRREHRTAKAFVNRISYPIIVTGLPILFPAILLAKGQFSHDLHIFFNLINEIVFPLRQPIFLPFERDNFP